MSSFSAHLGLDLLSTGVGDSILVHNASLSRLDGLVQGLVKSRQLSTPPGGLVAGDTYIVAGTGTGPWASKDKNIAYWTGSAWLFTAPKVGMQFWVEEEAVVTVCITGPSWKTRTGSCSYAGQKLSSNVQSIAGTGNVDLEWDSDLIDISDSAVFEHSTSVDPELITIREAGDYQIDVDVTVAATSTAAWTQMNLVLTTSPTGSPGSTTDVTGGHAHTCVRPTDFPKSTIHLSAVVTVAANTDIRVRVARETGTASTINVNEDTRIRITRI